MDVTEVLSGVALGDASLLHNGYSTEQILGSGSSVPCTKVAPFLATLIAGALTIDLTALVGTNGAAVDLTGLKIQAIKFRAPTTNSAVINIAPGVANDYDLLGASFSIDLLPGQEVMAFLNEAAPDVATADAEIDLAGTGTDALEVILVAG